MTWRRGLVLLIAAATAHADGAKTAADPLLNGVAMRLTAYKQAADLLGRTKTIVSAPAFLISRPSSQTFSPASGKRMACANASTFFSRCLVLARRSPQFFSSPCLSSAPWRVLSELEDEPLWKPAVRLGSTCCSG
jgi:hypothetical protein